MLPRRFGLRHGYHGIGSDVLACEMRLVEDRLHVLVTVIKQEVAGAIRQHLAAGTQMIGIDAHAQVGNLVFHLADAMRQIIDRNRVQDRKPLEGCHAAFLGAQVLTDIRQFGNGGARNGQELLSGLGKLNRIHGPLN